MFVSVCVHACVHACVCGFVLIETVFNHLGVTAH